MYTTARWSDRGRQYRRIGFKIHELRKHGKHGKSIGLWEDNSWRTWNEVWPDNPCETFFAGWEEQEVRQQEVGEQERAEAKAEGRKRRQKEIPYVD